MVKFSSPTSTLLSASKIKTRFPPEAGRRADVFCNSFILYYNTLAPPEGTPKDSELPTRQVESNAPSRNWTYISPLGRECSIR